jgi:hypothetical protein
MEQPVDDGVDFLDPSTRQRTQQRRNVSVRSQHHRDQNFLLLDACIGQITDLGIDPSTLARMLREHDDAGIRGVQSGIDACNDVVAGADLPFVEPRIDTVRAKLSRQLFHCRLVLRRMTYEYVHGPLTAKRRQGNADRMLTDWVERCYRGLLSGSGPLPTPRPREEAQNRR